jgi:hypothetical protein
MNPEEIVNRVQMGSSPADWRILRGNPSSSPRVFCGCFALGAVVLAAWMYVNVFFLGRHPVDERSLLHSAIPLLIALPVAVGIGVWLAMSGLNARSAGAPDPLLVLLRDGFVEYVGPRQPVLGVQFEDFFRVEQGIHASSSCDSTSHSSSCDSTSHSSFNDSTSTQVDVWLDLYRRDGSSMRWQPRANFGPTIGVCQEIVKAHAGYMALHLRG